MTVLGTLRLLALLCFVAIHIAPQHPRRESEENGIIFFLCDRRPQHAILVRDFSLS